MRKEKKKVKRREEKKSNEKIVEKNIFYSFTSKNKMKTYVYVRLSIEFFHLSSKY
jgi:hypothetical protein